jgi:immunity protein, SdpI family
MKLTWRTEWPLWVFLGAMFAGAAIMWPNAPGRIPIHWDMHGNVNGYGGKFEGLLLIPVIALIIYAVFALAPKLDPLHANYESFQGAFTLLRFAILFFLAVIQAIVYLWISGHPTPMNVIIPILVGALFIVLGFVLRKLRPNWFMGVRTPWTLMSRLSWTKTHAAAQWVFTVAGLWFMIAGFVNSPKAMIGAIVFMAAGMLTLVIYSYFVWRNDPDRVTPASLHVD